MVHNYKSWILTSLSSFNISYNPELLKTFQQQTKVKLIDPVITHIQNWLPNTGKLASFSILNQKDLPETSKKASEDHYGEDKVAQHILVNFLEMELISKVGLICHM